ncbi:MAG: DUF6152 family protein [Woeseiaceae bacterium]
MLSKSTYAVRKFAWYMSLILAACPATAHHSGAIYDDGRDLNLHGTVAKIRWANPHVIVEIDVSGNTGETVRWAIEGLAPGGLRSAGWTPDSLKPGDQVVASGSPARNKNKKILLGHSIVKTDGSVLNMPNLRNRHGLPPVDQPTPLFAENLSGRWATRWDPVVASEFFGARAKWQLTDKGMAAMESYDSSMDPGAKCIPEPIPYVMIFPAGKKIDIGDQTSTILDEIGMNREIHMTIQSHEGADYSDHGHSIGRWEEDVLVVDTTHFTNHRRGLALMGLPSGKQKHLIERFELRPDKTSLQYTYWLDDPEYLAEPVSGQMEFVYRPDVPFFSEPCDIENARNHLNE